MTGCRREVFCCIRFAFTYCDSITYKYKLQFLYMGQKLNF